MPSNLTKANSQHDMLNGRFTTSGGSAVLDRVEQERVTENRQAQSERAERRRPNSGQLILPEQVARQQGASTADLLDVHDPQEMQNAAKETGGSRVFNFSQGEGSDLDRNVKFVTNTNKDGKFERGALRIAIHDPNTQKREIHQRPMSDLPKLVAQVLAKKYEPTSQHRRNTQHVMKARTFQTSGFGGKRIQQGVSINNRDRSQGQGETHFATVNGHVIPIQDSQGGNNQGGQSEQSQENQQGQQDTQTNAAQPQEDKGAGLSHEQRTQIVNKLAGRMGVASEKIVMAEQDKEGDDGTLAADYEPNTDKITVYPNAFSRGKEELIGTLAHEANHAKLSQVLAQYNEQQKQFQAGTSLMDSGLTTFRELKGVFASSNRATYAIAGGVSKYGQQFVDAYQAEPSTQNYVKMVSENLAEAERLNAVGQGAGVSPQWNSLLNEVNLLAKGA